MSMLSTLLPRKALWMNYQWQTAASVAVYYNSTQVANFELENPEEDNSAYLSMLKHKPVDLLNAFPGNTQQGTSG